MVFPFLSIIAPSALFCYFFMKRTNRKATEKAEAFFERERVANSVRKQSLDDLSYINIDMNRIPNPDSYQIESLSDAYNKLYELSEKTIVNLTGVLNTDLKLKYGVANLPVLTEYDQNYTALCRAFLTLAKEYLNLSDKESAKMVLEYGIECKTDLKSHYILLADIYEEESEYEKIQWLISEAENINSMLKNSLIDELRGKIDLNKATVKVLEDIKLY